MRTRPYLLTEEHGVGFATADAIARANGTAIDSRGRLRAATVHLLREAELRGHTYLTRADLRAGARGLVGGALEDAVLEELADGAVIALAGDEVALASTFASLLSVVTGGPGTGKTTLVKAIVEQARAAKAELALCAPTGRAARRLEEATGHPATTIHRLVEWQPGHGPLRGAGKPFAGVTRARRACVLVGQRQALIRALGRADAFRRNTRLAGLLAAEQTVSA